MRSSVVRPIAERTPTTRFPASRAAASRRATAFTFSGSPTEVPPNFITTVAWGAAERSVAMPGTASYSVAVIAGQCRRRTCGRPSPVVPEAWDGV
jgi:hypothetical protein